MSERTPSQLKDMILSRIEKRKVLAQSTLDAAVVITKNREARAELSVEVKNLRTEFHKARKAALSAAKAEKAEARKAASAAKKAAKPVKKAKVIVTPAEPVAA